MAHRTSSHEKASPAARGTYNAQNNTVTFLLEKRAGVVDYALDQVFSKHQITVSGLANGTFDINVLVPGGTGFVELHTGKGEDDIVLIEDAIVSQIQLVVAGGNAADPVAHITSTPRMS